MHVKKESCEEGKSGFHCRRVRWGLCRHSRAAERALPVGVLIGGLLIEGGEGDGGNTFLTWL